MKIKYVYGKKLVTKVDAADESFHELEGNIVPSVDDGVYLNKVCVGFVIARYFILDEDEVHVVVERKD